MPTLAGTTRAHTYQVILTVLLTAITTPVIQYYYNNIFRTSVCTEYSISMQSTQTVQKLWKRMLRPEHQPHSPKPVQLQLVSRTTEFRRVRHAEPG